MPRNLPERRDPGRLTSSVPELSLELFGVDGRSPENARSPGQDALLLVPLRPDVGGLPGVFSLVASLVAASRVVRRILCRECCDLRFRGETQRLVLRRSSAQRALAVSGGQAGARSVR